MAKLKLLVGMACYDDFDGVYFTLQSLRLHHAEVMQHVEVAVVDNNPDGAHGKAVRDLFGWIKGDVAAAHYVPYTQTTGTAATRNHLFTLGTAPAVMCVDPHVLFAPGSIKRLLDWYDTHPDAMDLYQGPMIYDDLKNFATHFDNRWDGEMWGKWGSAWRVEPDLIVEVRDGKTYRLPDYTPVDAKAVRPAAEHPDDAPFEIPAMGLGLFTCRREAWLGFNPNFKGFGGEEWYIHEKYRQAGRKTLCLPFLRWLHRFGRPGGVKYPLQAWDKVRNYVIGHKELGLDLTPIHDHFVASGKISQENWQALLDGKDQPVAAKGCGCNAAASSAAAAVTLEDAYQRAAGKSSDINEHVPTLRQLASQCAHVTEFGTRTGISTTGLLAGQPKSLVSYDVQDRLETKQLARLAGDTKFEFKIGDSTSVDIEETDLLFIDSKHTAQHVYAELTRHHAKVRKWIAFHDTEIFGERGEDGGAGLLPALRKFLKEHPEWSVIRHDANNHGFTIISRDPADKPALPSAGRQFLNFTKALAKHVAGGLKTLSEEQVQARLDVCALCPQRNNDRCSKCGCFLVERPDGGPGKTLMPTEVCPLGKWFDVEKSSQ